FGVEHDQRTAWADLVEAGGYQLALARSREDPGRLEGWLDVRRQRLGQSSFDLTGSFAEHPGKRHSEGGVWRDPHHRRSQMAMGIGGLRQLGVRVFELPGPLHRVHKCTRLGSTRRTFSQIDIGEVTAGYRTFVSVV